MAKIAKEETEKALKELVAHKQKKEKPKEEKEEKVEEKIQEDKEVAAAWLTGGLESEVSSSVSAPVLESHPVELLDDFASQAPSREKKAEKKETRMYETEGTRKYDSQTHKRELYEETPENLFGRIVKPMNVLDLRPEPRMDRIRTAGEQREEFNPERALTMKYADRTPAETLPFRRGKEDLKKYEF
jgi:hypothetical protein